VAATWVGEFAGSETVGWSIAGPSPACFLMDEEVMKGVSWHLRDYARSCGRPPTIAALRIRQSVRLESDGALAAGFR
jgi:hypothetical protein